jgi:hypothetical protein
MRLIVFGEAPIKQIAFMVRLQDLYPYMFFNIGPTYLKWTTILVLFPFLGPVFSSESNAIR